MANSEPYLSIIAASRNDDHGGDPLQRTQIFLNCFAWQCEKFRLPAEVVLIDWNPVVGRPGLADVLTLPDSSYCSGRVITVPGELHRRVKYSDKLSFFQMIAKNVGIRRARGRFVLATNIDIIFSHELVAYLAEQSLDSAHCYRVDRHDVSNGVKPGDGLDAVMEHCWSKSIRQHRRYAPAELVASLYGENGATRIIRLDPKALTQFQGISFQEGKAAVALLPERNAPVEHLHTNGCGDFTLLAREAWESLRGYPEYEAFSFNIDSVGFLFAHYSGYTEATLLPPCVAFHLEHSIGSGWTPEGERKLFDRLEASGILNPEWPVLRPIVEQIRERRGGTDFNSEHWGFSLFDLPEAPLKPFRPSRPALTSVVVTDSWPQFRVSSLQSEHDLDRVTLFCERRAHRAEFAKSVAPLQLPFDAEAERRRLDADRAAYRLERGAVDEERQIIAQERNRLSNEYHTLGMERQFLAEARRRLAEDRFLIGRTGVASTDAVKQSIEILEIFIPNAQGLYSTDRRVVGGAVGPQFAVQCVNIPEFSSKYPLRIDPVGHPGTVLIRSMTFISLAKTIELVNLAQLRKAGALSMGGTATIVQAKTETDGEPLALISTGLDPQLMVDLSHIKGTGDSKLLVMLDIAFIAAVE